MTAPAVQAAIRIVVYGIPAPQGSKSFKGFRAGRAVMVESSKKVKPWRECVEIAARQAVADLPREQRRLYPIDAPVTARIVFTLPKSGLAVKQRRVWPDRYPDVSKLLRSTEDALKTAGVWADDARVVNYDRLAKVFPGGDPDALDQPGCVIEIRPIAALTTREETRHG